MARVSPSDIDRQALNRLRSQVRAYFKMYWYTDWARHSSVFTGYEHIPNKNNFYEDVKDRIDQKLSEKYGLIAASKKSVSIDSVRRFLLETKDSFDDKVLEAFLLLTGSDLTWDEYKVSNLSGERAYRKAGMRRKTLWLGAVFFLITALSAVTLYRLRPHGPAEVYLSTVLIPGSSGIPKVKITYDLKGAQYKSATIFFDHYRLNLMSEKGDTLVGSVLPGKSVAKLYLDDKLVRTIPVLIPSSGWAGSINNKIPLNQETFLKDGELHFRSSDKLKEMYGPEYYTSFLNFREFGVHGDSFSLEAELMNSEATGGLWAYDVSVDIVGTKEDMVFNLLSPDATMYARLSVAETDFSTGVRAGVLPRLGVDLSHWRQLNVSTRNQRFQISLDNEVLVESDYTGEIGEIVGVQFYLKGSGAVRNVSLQPFGEPEKRINL